MKSVNYLMKFFFICYVIILAQGCNGENMNIQIELIVENPTAPIRLINEIPIYPMGHNLSLKTLFNNNSSTVITIEDPNTSQKYLLKMKREGVIEDNYFMINPSQIDATGEVTSPISKTVTIKPDEIISHSFELYKIISDKCFIPGFYNLYIEFDEVKSELLSFGVEYRPESVSKLTDILIDEQADKWLRSESAKWLNKLSERPDIIMGSSGETEDEKNKRIVQNKENLKLFLHQWHYDESTDETQLFFEQFRLSPEVMGE